MKISTLVLGLSALLATAPARAQEVRPSESTPSVGQEVVGPAVTAAGLPGSYQVVSVPIPAAFARDSAVAFEVLSSADFPVLGRREGVVARSTGSVLVTIGIPRGALAGEIEAARVRFRSSSGSTSAVPVLVAVDVVRRVVLDARDRISAVRPGEDVVLDLNIRNAGNAPDTLRLELVLPDDWKLRSGSFGPVVLAGGASASRAFAVRAPNEAGVGDHFLRVLVLGSDSSHAERLVTLGVGDRLAGEMPPGPVMEMSVGTVSIDGRAPASVAQVAVHGPVTGAIGIDARAGIVRTLQPAELRGLARVGSYVADPQLSLWSERGRLGIGNAYGSISDLTGTNVGGQGLTLAYLSERWGLSGIAARPTGGGGGRLLGARVTFDAFGAELGASGSDFQGGARDPRRLTSAGLDATAGTRFGEVGGGIAYREYGADAGVGVSGTFQGGDTSGHLSVRAQHAPGGSRAFARAADELEVLADRWIGKLNVAGSWTGMRDQSPAFSSLASSAWSLAPQYRLASGTTLRIDVRGDSYEAKGETGFGSATRQVAAGVSSGAGRLFYSAELGAGRATRSIETEMGRFSSSGAQFTWRTNASYQADFGRFQVDQSYEKNGGPDIGPDQFSLAARAEQLRAAMLPAGLMFEGEIAYQRLGSDRSFATVRAGASYTLPQGVELRLSLERNPLYSSVQGTTPWMTSIRVGKTLTLPRLRYGSATGLVFQDLNGNGRRDAGEEGVPNVTVRQGSERAITDRNGQLIFWQSKKGEMTVEPTGLPYGWIVGSARGADSREIALVPTSSVRVVLDLAAPELARGVDLTPAVVIARDASGRQWSARRTTADGALFDVLPVGEYTLSFDFSGMSEPMRVEGEHHFTVRGRGVETVTVPVLGRPLRFRNPQEPRQ